MPQTLVGLFLDPAQARRVTAELSALGVAPKQIEVLDFYVSSFEKRIDGAGIPVDDAAIYKEGVRRGGALVLAGVENDLADRAGILMDNHGAADIDDLAQAWSDAAAEAEKGNASEKSSANEEFSPPEYETAAAPPAEPGPLVEEFRMGDASHGTTTLTEEPVSAGDRTDQERQGPEQEVQEPVAAMPAGESEIELPGGLRLRSVVVETPVERNVPLLGEHVTVERRPANREATQADFQAFEQGVMDLVELAEELIVSKKARVVEEVVITKKVRETTETVRENLKHTRLTTTILSDRDSSPQ